MFKTTIPYTKKQPNNISVVNKNSIINNDLTGSLSNISIPTKLTSNSKTKKKPKLNIFSKNVNNTIIDNTWVTAGNGTAKIPSEYTNPGENTIRTSVTKKQTHMSIVNTKVIRDNFRKETLEYSAKYIRKQITSFNSGSNQLIIAAASLDYGTELVSADNFEILYNGIHIPGIYTVEQSGSDVVITLEQDYIDYNNLVPESTEIYIYGKFK